MQETGNNDQTNSKILSVRITSNGLSYSVILPSGGTREHFVQYSRSEKSHAEAVRNIVEAQDELSTEFGSVQVFLDTADVVYVPAEVLETVSAEEFLADAGVRPKSTDKVVISPVVNDLCAVIAFDGKVIKYLDSRFGKKAVYFSPLQENLEMRTNISMKGSGYILNITESNIYITMFDALGRLTVAESYPYQSDADVVYYLFKLTEKSGAPQQHFYLYGSNAQTYARTIRKYFKGTVCV